MWSVPFNLNLYDTYLGLAMIYNQVRSWFGGHWFYSQYSGTIQLILLLVQKNVLL